MKQLHQAKPRRNASRRTGGTLLEMVIVIGVSSILMGVVTMTMQHILLTNSQMRDRVRNSLAHQRLGRLFRQDCHDAVSADSEQQSLVLTTSQGTVTYKTDGNIVTRSWQSDGNKGSDRFYSTRDWNAAIAVDDKTAKLSISHRPGGAKRTLPGKPRTIEFVATVGAYSSMISDIESPETVEPTTAPAEKKDQGDKQ